MMDTTASEGTKTMIGYRVQRAYRNVAELTDPEHQISRAYCGDPNLTRRGVSVCASKEDLALYLVSGIAGAFTVREGGWVIVCCEGPESGDVPVDWMCDEYLILPERVLSVEEIDEEFFNLMDEISAEIRQDEVNYDEVSYDFDD